MTPSRRRLTGVLLALAMCASSCEEADKPGLDLPSTVATTPAPDPEPPPPDRAPDSSVVAMERLCEEPEFPEPSPVKASAAVPPEIARLQRRVEIVRDLRYRDPVAAESVNGSEMSRRVTEAFEIQYPRDFYARRSKAWSTVGVLPEGTNLREALLSFGEGGIVGFYDPATGELVYIGSGDLGFAETFTLAHELTHAIDDQHFDLTRLDPLVTGCRDEEFQAALGAVEGSAQFFATEVLREFPAPVGADDLDIGGDLSALDDVPPFLLALQLWPYNYGHGFIIALERRGGLDLVNRALRRFPVSTEQVLHPERYPNDLPQPLDVPALEVAGWEDLDVMQVGEEWLRAMLELRVDQDTADAASAGWDGGVYRAWTSGAQVAVALRTVWDSPTEARQFHDAIDLWIGESDASADVRLENGDGVLAVFATDDATLQLISSAV
jgi:hypothetical protein